MSKNVAVFVDVANLYYSARGQEIDVDYVALLKAATKGRDLIRAYAYSGLDPENENQRKFIDFLGKNGYKVVVKDIRKFGDGRVKANLDIELVVDLFRLADRMDIAVIISGDGDFAPAIRALQDKGVRCEVISFRPNTSSDLLAVADEFLDIMKVIGIDRVKKKTGMSAPAMPAKEVVPEFGFREAPPHVAAAALAALKGGAERRASDAAGDGESENGDADSAETRRRRRRRGGRGRGRGRAREGEQEAAAEPADDAAPVADVDWQELDDLSQIADLGEEREYTFSEADPETLAELGLTTPDGAKAPDVALGEAEAARATAPPEEAAALAVEEQPVEPKPKTRRRRSAKQTDADAAAEEATARGSQDDAAEKKPRRRTRRPASASSGSDESPEQTEPEDKKPRRRRTTRAAGTADEKAPAPASPDSEASDPSPESEAPSAEKPSRSRARRRAAPRSEDAASSEDGGDHGAGGQEGRGSQGIWQRFRSARGNTNQE